MTLSDMRRIADLCGVKIHTYSITPGTIYVKLYPAPQATVRLFVECMDGAMPSSMQTVVSYTSGAPSAAQGRPHDTSCTCETCRPPAVLTLDELRLREAQAGTMTAPKTPASARARAPSPAAIERAKKKREVARENRVGHALTGVGLAIAAEETLTHEQWLQRARTALVALAHDVDTAAPIRAQCWKAIRDCAAGLMTAERRMEFDERKLASGVPDVLAAFLKARTP